MKIPSRFKLLGQTINVRYNPTLVQERDWTGLASYRRNAIEIMPHSEANRKNPDQIEHTFVHEMIHHILYYAGAALQETDHNKMHTDEGFVDVLAGLLHQALTTMEYDEVNAFDVVSILDSLDDSLDKALYRKGRKVSEMESHLIDVSVDLGRLREIIAPGTMKTPFDVEA